MEQNIEMFYEGVPIAIVGYLIVFAALVILYLIFDNVAKLVEYRSRRKYEKNNNKNAEKDKQYSTTGDVSAAIATALYLYFEEMHDEETGKLTVKRVSKRYTPWNSKIYNVMNRL